MRCLAISRALDDCQITFLGSNLAAYAAIIPSTITCIHLPLDTPRLTDEHYVSGTPVEGLHYAPLNVQGQRARSALLTQFFHQTMPLLLVVDVSVEVTLLARLCGVPTLVVRQHGNRQDLPHQLAYQSAQWLLAPYPRLMQQPDAPWLAQKTVYTGGFSRYDAQPTASQTEQAKHVAVLVGSGGTCIDLPFVAYLARQAPAWRFEAIGQLAGSAAEGLPDNLVLHGHLDEPRTVLDRCWIILGNAGHNTVMEMASLKKRFIVVPEDRPFAEQRVKADLLAQLALAHVLQPEQLYQTYWPALLLRVEAAAAAWPGIVSPAATAQAARLIHTTYESLYDYA